MKMFCLICTVLVGCGMTSTVASAGIIDVAYHKVTEGAGGRAFSVDHTGGYCCPDVGNNCDMVVTTENPDGSWTTEVEYPCGILVHANVGNVTWTEVNGSRQGNGSFAGNTFMSDEYVLKIEEYSSDNTYNGLYIPLNGITADAQGWIHVFVPHP